MRLLPILVTLPAFAAAASCPDLTSQLEDLGNPNATYWTSGSTFPRHVPDLFPHQGKIYTSGGDWENNAGPCPIFAIDPYTGAWSQDWIAGTEAVYEFKEFSDGRLYLPSIDIKERDYENQTAKEVHQGSHFRIEADGNWREYETALGTGNITQWAGFDQGYRVHNWDMAEHKGHVFICGYGISGSTNWGETAMYNATPSLTSALRSGLKLRRFYSFLVFDDGIYNFTCQPSNGSNFKDTPWEEWRLDESDWTFKKQDASWDDIAPGVTADMLTFANQEFNGGGFLDDGPNVWLWHPTRFGNRTLYILGGERYGIVPVAAFSAVNTNNHVKATRIDLGGGDVHPFDICVAGGAAYIVAAQGNGTSSDVTNSVWKSTDGVTFTKLFTFTATRPASAICHCDGMFFFGMGSDKWLKKSWGNLGEDIAGRIYRLRLPQAPVAVEASPASLAMNEGETKTVSFRLASAPATNMTLHVRGTGRNAYWDIGRETLTFTPQNWNVPQAVAFSVEDFGDGDYSAALVCGTGGADCDSAAVALAVTGRPFAPPADPAAVTLYDTMTIGGTSGTTASGVRILTDYVPKWNSIVRTKYADDPDANATQFLFCSRAQWNSEVFAWAARIGNKQCVWYFNDKQHYSWENVVSNEEAFLEVKNGDAVLTRLSDENRWYLTNDVPVATFTPQYRMSLFQSYQTGSNYGNWNNSFRGDFHYLQIFEEEAGGHEVLKHHFVPCVVSNDVKVCDIADGNRIYDLTKASGGTASIGAGVRAVGLLMPGRVAPPPVTAEAEGLDWTNRLFSVSGLAPGAEVTLAITGRDASTMRPQGQDSGRFVETPLPNATFSAVADSSGAVSFSPATAPGAFYRYTLSAGGETIASGSFLAGAWDADGSWFDAMPDGAGGSSETGGAWTAPPEGTNATAYVSSSATEFTLDAATRAAGTGKVVRATSALRYDFLNEASDTFTDLALGDTLAAITAVTNSSAGGAARWKACVGGAWVALDGAVAPAPHTDYLVRLEGDFTLAAPRIRLSVSADGGASYAVLSSAATGDEWIAPNNAAATALTGIATDGSSDIAALRGALSNAFVAETGGVRYASLADALRAAGKGGTVTLLTNATAPASLVAGRAIDNNGHILVTYNDWHGTLLFMP